MMKPKRIGFIVFEVVEQWEQPLSLDFGDGNPEKGVLNWRGKDPAYLFATRKLAQEAINRTEHYRLAFGSNHPEKKLCKIVAVEAVAATE